MSTAKDFVSTLKETGPKTSAYDTTATVIRIEGQTAWVHIPGGVSETPASMTIDAKPGDTVQVRVSGGRAFLVGNSTAPPTDDTKANKAKTAADEAKNTASKAKETADGAKDSADSAIHLAEGINEHFWHDSTGAHITEDTQEDYQADPANAGGNTLITSQGMAVRRGQTELAVFSASGAQIGQDVSGKSRSIVDENGMRVIRKSSDGDVLIANLGYDEAVLADGSTALVPYFSFGKRAANSTIGGYSVSEGRENESSNYCSHAEGFETEASGVHSHAEGELTHAQGDNSHAEGMIAYATGHISHAEGLRTEARGNHSHAEGMGSVTGITLASGDASHAEGVDTVASGNSSHSQNAGTIAQGMEQTAIGSYNVPNGSANVKANTDHAFIIGNGTGESNRSNALTVDWDGNVDAAGTLIGDSGNYLTAQKSFTNTSERVSLSSSTTDKTVLSVTASKTGYVIVSGFVTMTTNNSGNRHVTIDVDGTKFYNDTRPAHATNNGQMGCCAICRCHAGETIAIQAWQTSGTTLYAGGRIDAVFL